MNGRDQQICDKLLAEIAVTKELLQGISEEAFLCDERTARAISGMRDVTAHKYQTLRKADVYHTCAEDLPVFEKQLLRMVQE